jgi:ABC-type transport system involved in cytochrome c biogenesis permease subunit
MGTGLFLGHIQANTVFGAYWVNDPKIIITDIIWIFYFAGYLLARILKWRGKWMAILSLSGFTILLLAAILVMMMTETFHKFY